MKNEQRFLASRNNTVSGTFVVILAKNIDHHSFSNNVFENEKWKNIVRGLIFSREINLSMRKMISYRVILATEFVRYARSVYQCAAILSMSTRSPPRLLDLQSATSQQLVALLSQDDDLNANGSFREQCYHACRILQKKHQSVAPDSLIDNLFHMDKGIIRKEWKHFIEDADQAPSRGRPPILTALQVP
jgi:hypothetical protein